MSRMTRTPLRPNLRKQFERVRTEPGLKRNVSVLAALVVVALVAGGGILSQQRFNAPWSDTFELNAEFEALPGIAPGNGQEVRLAGVVIGQITGARVNREGRPELRMELEKGHPIYDNARLVLRPKSPLNEMYVTIDPGTPQGRLLHSGDHLGVANTERPVQVDEVLSSLDDNTRRALTALLRESDVATAHAPSDLPAGLEQLAGFTESMRPVAEQLASRRELLQRLVTASSRISSAVGGDDRRLVALASSLDTTLASLADGNTAVDASLRRLPELARRMTAAASGVRRLSAQLDPTLRDLDRASIDLPPALKKLSSTTDALADVVDAAGPTARAARPVLADLRPFTQNLRVALPRLGFSTSRLDPVTATLLDYRDDVAAFFVNTRSLTSMKDSNGGILRGMLELTTTSLPSGALAGLSPDDVTGPTR